MSEEKKEAQKALLGELESIKSLLSEDEWDDIPLLSDPLPAPSTDTAHSSTYEHHSPATPISSRETSDIDAAVDKINFDLNLETEEGPGQEKPEQEKPEQEESEQEELDEFDDVPVLEEVYRPEDSAPPLDNLNPPAPTPISEDNLIGDEPPAEEPSAKEGLSATLQEFSATSEEPFEEEPLASFEEPLATHEEPLASFEEPLATHEEPLASFEEPLASLEEPLASHEKPVPPEQPSAVQGEAPLSPGALPGQHNLFDTKISTSTEHKISNPQSRTSNRPAVQSRGENPFLPQHIRERLHTHKALLDIIKESPLPITTPVRPARHTASEQSRTPEQPQDKLPPVLPPEKLHQMVEGIIAVYLPKIEAELRKQLLETLQSDEPTDV